MLSKTHLEKQKAITSVDRLDMKWLTNLESEAASQTVGLPPEGHNLHFEPITTLPHVKVSSQGHI